MDKSPRKGKKRSGRVRTEKPALEDPGVHVGRQNVILFLAGLGAIVLGFILLSLGSTAFSAILLVGGYLVLIPWAILAGRADKERPADSGD